MNLDIAVQNTVVALLVGGSILYVVRAAWRGIRAAGSQKSSGCGSCNACGRNPPGRG